MFDSLRNYYQRELHILRDDGAAFAARYPKIAPQLGFASDQNPDPLVERLLESLAYLSARVRQESEAELPSLAGQILHKLCPTLAAPLPSISVVSFAPDYSVLEKVNEWVIPAGTRLYSEPEEDNAVIRWRTAWPLTLSAARVTQAALLDIGLIPFDREDGECAVMRLRFSGIKTGATLRLFLKGNRFSTFPLHDWVHRNTLRLLLADPVDGASSADIKPLSFARDFLKPAGLEPESLILPGHDKSWAGFRLIQEYFACPERFLFWELGPFPDMTGFSGSEVDLFFLLKEPPPEDMKLRPGMFDPAAVPVINLFERPAEPVRADHRRTSYPLYPDLRRSDSTEIHSVLSVTAITSGGRSFRVPHFFDQHGGDLAWDMRLSPAPDGKGTTAELYLLGGDMAEEFTVTAQALCTNRHLAARQGSAGLSAETEIPAAISLALPPSPQRDPVWSGDERWRLVSNFAMPQESLSGTEGLQVLKTILSQYAPQDDAYSGRQIAGLHSLTTGILFHPLRPSADHPLGALVRGLNIDLELDEDAFRGGSPFIFAGVLDVFMGLRSAINHITRLRIFLSGRKGVYHIWAPRCGDRALL